MPGVLKLLLSMQSLAKLLFLYPTNTTDLNCISDLMVRLFPKPRFWILALDMWQSLRNCPRVAVLRLQTTKVFISLTRMEKVPICPDKSGHKARHGVLPVGFRPSMNQMKNALRKCILPLRRISKPCRMVCSFLQKRMEKV